MGDNHSWSQASNSVAFDPTIVANCHTFQRQRQNSGVRPASQLRCDRIEQVDSPLCVGRNDRVADTLKRNLEPLASDLEFGITPMGLADIAKQVHDEFNIALFIP